MPQTTVDDLARRVGGDAHGDGDRVIRGVGPLDTATPDQLSLVASRKYLPYLADSRAGALLVSADLAAEVPAGRTSIRVPDAHLALVEVLGLLYPEPAVVPGVHPTAVVAAGVELADGVSVGAYAVIGAGSRIGAGARIGAHVVVGERCTVGEGSVIHPHATLYDGVVVGSRCTIHSGVRLGSDGFGYAWTGREHRKVPQVGGCRVEDDVEIGANTAIDRGSIGDTVIGEGSKIDNLVHVGHNVRLGRRVIVVAQVGVSGSTVVGDGAVLGGQAGLVGHISIGAGARVGAQAGVIGDVAPGETVSGYPARPHREAMRAQAALFRLPDLVRRIARLEAAAPGRRGEDATDTSTSKA